MSKYVGSCVVSPSFPFTQNDCKACISYVDSQYSFAIYRSFWETQRDKSRKSLFEELPSCPNDCDLIDHEHSLFHYYTNKYELYLYEFMKKHGDFDYHVKGKREFSSLQEGIDFALEYLKENL